MKMKKWPFVYVGIITVLTYIPILVTVVYSFNASKISSIWEGFSLKWYVELFQDRDMKEALINSLILAGLSCLLAIFIGTAGALGMHRAAAAQKDMSRKNDVHQEKSLRGKTDAHSQKSLRRKDARRQKSRLNDVVSYVSMIPIMIPEIILGMVFLSVFSLMGLPFGMLTLVIAHTTFCIPYIFSMVKARLVGMDKALEEAALDLGASPVRVFFDVTLPLIMPAIMSGAMLAFAMSFDDVVISIFVTGPTVNTLPVKIYTKMKTGVTPEVNALATLMLLVTVLLMAASALVGRKKSEKQI